MRTHRTNERKAGLLNSRRLAALVAAATVLTLAALAPHASAQTKKPISKDGLVKAIRINGLSTAEMVEQIETRGVAFQMTPAIEQEMRAAGARPEIIEAARSNYRPASAVSGGAAARVKTQPVPAGKALSKAEIVTMLQAGTPSPRVEQFVDARGVNFQATPSDAREIKAAGGTNSLVGAITSAYAPPGRARTPPPASRRAAAPAPARGPDYDDLTDQATAAYDARDAARATQLLRQAIGMDASQPRAYQLLGFTQLYLQRNLAEAEQNMRKAIELGGSAAFRVFHDHAEGSFNKTCSGTLFVTKTNVTFRADDGVDTFAAEDSTIGDIDVNKFVGRNPLGALLGGMGGKGDLGAFHIRVGRGKGSRNYNFAPLTSKTEESKLIIELVRSYGGVKG